MGDERFVHETKVFYIDNAHFESEKWERFKELHFMFEEIVGKVIDEFTTEIDKEKAEESVKYLSELVESFVAELEVLADFTIKNIDELRRR